MFKHYSKFLIAALFILIGLVFLLLFKPNLQITQAQATQVSPPTNLSTSVTNGRIINLSWNAPAESVVGYTIHCQSTPSYCPSTTIATTTATTYSYALATLPGHSYCFTVKSYDSNNTYSDPTPQACASVSVGTSMAPTDLTATVVSSNRVNLTWQYAIPPEQWAILDYKTFLFILERSIDGGSSWSINGNTGSIDFGSGTSPQITATDTAAPTGSTLKYRVTAFDETNNGGPPDTGFSVPSNIATAVTPQVGSAPNAPSNLTVNFGSVATEINLLFNDNSNDETGWVIERCVSNTCADFSTYNNPNSATTFTYPRNSLPTISLNTTYTLRVRAVNSFGRSEPSNTVTIETPPPLAWTPPVPSEHMLIVYNLDDSRSVYVKNYYLANRPLISGANVLGVHFPAPGFDPAGFDVIAINNDVYQSGVLTPITDWLRNHDKPIRYIVLMWGMPTQVYKYPYGINGYEPGSVDYQISTSLQTLGARNGAEYKNGQNTNYTRYISEYYKGTTALVTHIDVGSVADTKAYIDKLRDVYDGMADKNIILSARNAGIGGDTYYFDESATGAREAVRAENSSASVVYNTTGFPLAGSNVLGYSTKGMWNPGMGAYFATDGKVVFSGNSGWYIMRTTESYNGVRAATLGGQSSFTSWFSANAWGGALYSNTPVGAIAHVNEPSGEMNFAPEFFSLWERGYTFAEAAWASRRTIWFLAVGDPLVAIGSAPANASACTGYQYSNWGTCNANGTQTRTVTGNLPAGCAGTPSASPVTSQACTVADTTPPTISGASPSGTLSANTTSANLSVSTSENATCRYSATAGTSFTSMSRTFSTTGGTNHSTSLTGLSSGTSFTYYVRCRDAALNANLNDYLVSFSVASASANLICTDYQYTNWSVCNNGTQIRSVNGNLPAGCAGTPSITPLTSQACNNDFDTTPPNIQNGLPSGTLPASTTSATLSVTTSENATCKYSTNAGTSFTSMGSTFTTTGSATHSTALMNLSSGTSYRYYVRCRDAALNANLSDYPVAFSVAAGIPAPNPPQSPDSYAQQWRNILTDAATMSSGNLATILSAVGAVRNIPAETAAAAKYTVNLIGGLARLSDKAISAITNFVTYGTRTTKKLGAGERAGVINSYKAAFSKLPTAQTEWKDAMAIGNGRWPGEKSAAAETKAAREFKKVYKRTPDMQQVNDNAAVTVISYGLRPANRNTNSEKAAIKSFRAIYSRAPLSATDWDIVRAIAYSGATR